VDILGQQTPGLKEDHRQGKNKRGPIKDNAKEAPPKGKGQKAVQRLGSDIVAAVHKGNHQPLGSTITKERMGIKRGTMPMCE